MIDLDLSIIIPTKLLPAEEAVLTALEPQPATLAQDLLPKTLALSNKLKLDVLAFPNTPITLFTLPACLPLLAIP